MDMYSNVARWKIYLVLAGILVLGASMLYTNYLASRLSEGERDKAALLTKAYEVVNNNPDLNADISFEAEIILNNTEIPLIATDFSDEILWGRAFGPKKDTNMVFLRTELKKIQENGPEPILYRSPASAFKIYYKQSRLHKLLTYFPIFQLLLLGAFVSVAFIGFSSAKKAEQNRVWAGMAKETAHQLGTPISAIVAWIEHLKLLEGLQEEESMEIITELENDVHRLELIADRFSKIGSAPKLEPVNIYEELEQCRDYMAKRASKRIRFDFPPVSNPPLFVNINSHLFDWVVENLTRNALDAMDGTGVISAHVTQENHYVVIDITDTGKGIHPSKIKTVFKPGYTTKQRGWGLGLSLARRIIEHYHSGKIFVKSSKPGEGTTFCIKLPV